MPLSEVASGTQTDPYQVLALKLRECIGSEAVLDNPESLALFGQDVSGDAHPPVLIARPGDTESLVQAVRFAAQHDLYLVPRGGGMSYSSGYVCPRERLLCIDTSAMNRLLEVNMQDMYVTAEVGCTWHDLHEAIEPLGVRTPFWGTLSGLKASIGGGLSQNSIFWGSGRHGASADSVLSLDVVLASGQVLSTGANSKSGGSPFFRHYGPDLTGLFTSDTGALGIKATATLRLLPVQPGKAFSSFEFDDHMGMIEAMSEVSRQALAEACFGFDPTLQAMRMKRVSLLEDVKTLGKVMKAQEGTLKGIREGIRIAGSGRGFMKGVRYSAHFTVEEATEAVADGANQRIAEICVASGGREIENSIPKIARALPFPPLNSMIGPGGERWLPVHGLVPHSKACATLELLEALFEQNAGVMQAHDILHGYMFTYVGTSCFVIEPVFYWPDELNALHRLHVDDALLGRVNDYPPNQEARTEVMRLRREVVNLFERQGALHLQIGRTYPYMQGLRDTPRDLIKGLKRLLDPEGRINPGSLGLE